MKTDKILLDHGSGGKIFHELITGTLLPLLGNPTLSRLDDGAVLELSGGRLAFSTDSYVVDPVFFPGGSIGDLAVNGTVNDLSMCGAEPLFLSLGLIVEEGFSIEDFRRILEDIRDAAKAAGVEVVTGDTKVVPKGAADKIFINTSGIGRVPEGVSVSGVNACSGDRIILSGSIGDHGVTILTQREGLSFASAITSDTTALNGMVHRMLKASDGIHALRDPTRGGVATALSEIARQSEVGIRIDEKDLPVKKEVAGVCELLGFDPLYIANEGKLLAFVKPEDAEDVLRVIREFDSGKDAVIIGEVVSEHPGKVFMKTRIGGMRIVDMLAGDQLPRIC